MRKIQGCLLLFVSVLLSACNNVENTKQKNIDPEAIFFTYKIWGEEGNNDVTCMIQYRHGSPDGTAFLLKSPGKVALDGEVLIADSIRLSGVYYEKVKPLTEFSGKHTIDFTDSKGRPFTTDFEFIAFSLVADLPQKIQRKPFRIKLKNFPAAKTALSLTMTDTAFATEDVNQIYMVTNSEITITDEMLSRLKNGPIALQLTRDEEKQLKYGTKESGKVSISYGLRREFDLVD